MGSIVITTIQLPTASVLAVIAKARTKGLKTLVIGDRKTPAVPWPEGAEFMSLSDQIGLNFKLAAKLPENHYARKNIGYLMAMSHQSTLIFDTDDDNAPLDSWEPRSLIVLARPSLETGWINAYRWFSDAHIWPRGLPLDRIRYGATQPKTGVLEKVVAPVQQGLVNGSPDVDAVWRLMLDEPIIFQDKGSVYLTSGAWCPFNSQSTWWFPEAYPLMYLPSFVSFRMTDIWRSFIAQRCLWAMGYGIVFHGPEMFQERNPHNLLRDFEQEIPGYLGNSRICEVLENVPLSGKIEATPDNLHRCYEALVSANFVPAEEMPLVEAWIMDNQTYGKL